MHKPVYRSSYDEARRTGETQQWRESMRENMRCAKAIADTITENFDGMHLNEDCQRSVIEAFGFDRVNYVLATTLQEHEHDGRFSDNNKEWARRFYLPEAPEHRCMYTVTSHPAVLDGFINAVRRQWNELGLFDETHCIPDSQHGNFEGELLIMRPERLTDEYKSPERQLFLAETGLGCSDTARDRAVIGRLLHDGEQYAFNREDFLGVADSHYLPDWVFEKLDELQQSDGQTDSMTMQ